MAEMTWGTGFRCPRCGKEATYTTKGVFGGILMHRLLGPLR